MKQIIAYPDGKGFTAAAPPRRDEINSLDMCSFEPIRDMVDILLHTNGSLLFFFKSDGTVWRTLHDSLVSAMDGVKMETMNTCQNIAAFNFIQMRFLLPFECILEYICKPEDPDLSFTILIYWRQVLLLSAWWCWRWCQQGKCRYTWKRTRQGKKEWK